MFLTLSDNRKTTISTIFFNAKESIFFLFFVIFCRLNNVDIYLDFLRLINSLFSVVVELLQRQLLFYVLPVAGHVISLVSGLGFQSFCELRVFPLIRPGLFSCGYEGIVSP